MEVKQDPPDEKAMYEAVHKKAMEVARTKTNDGDQMKELAAEAVAGVFFKLDANPKALPTRDQRDRFINTMVRNKNIDGGRRWATHQRTQDEIGREMDASASRFGNPEADTDASRLHGLVYTALSELSRYYEQLVYMYHIDGMTYEEIAAEMEMTPGSVKTELGRARAELRKRKDLRAHHDEWEQP